MGDSITDCRLSPLKIHWDGPQKRRNLGSKKNVRQIFWDYIIIVVIIPIIVVVIPIIVVIYDD